MTDPFLKQALFIGEIPENIDLDSPPVTGFDYLYRVRLETKNCPKVVVSNIDTTQFIHHQTVKVDVCNGFIRAPPGLEPNLKWQEDQLSLFTKTRDQLRAQHDALMVKFPKREFPRINKKEEWCLYCLGREKYEQIYGKKEEKVETEDDSPKQKRTRIADEGNGPVLSIILYLSQNSVTKLLSYHIDWLEKAKFSHDQGAWIYALLIWLEKPLQPDTCALLRSLSRVCSSLRSDLCKREDSVLKILDAINAIITIISQYFDQKDMSDNFPNDENEVLSK